jgi:hypothetical protein
VTVLNSPLLDEEDRVFIDASLNAAISQLQLEIEAAEESGDIRAIKMEIEALEAPPDLDEVERYRQASGDALQQLDWCIGYMCGSGRVTIARSLSKNRAYIRTQLLKRAEQPLPTEQPGPTQKTEVS